MLRGTMIVVGWVLGLALFTVPVEAKASDRCTLMAVTSSDDADLRVYFTRFKSEDRTEGRYRRCRIVDTAEEGTQTFYVTPFRRDANLVVHPSNWPR